MEEALSALDHDLLLADPANPEANLATKDKRIANHLIDMVCYLIMAFVLSILTAMISTRLGWKDLTLGAFVILIVLPGSKFLYYSLFESKLGKTIGKMITCTRVVNKSGGRIGSGKAVLRTLCRFIPFEVFSFLFKRGVGWHDSFSGTRVING